MIRDFPVIEAGWWAEHVPGDVDAGQVAELVRELRPEHPALPRLETIARNWLIAQGRRERLFRCGACRDACWVERSDGRMVRCRGGLSSGCPADAARQDRLREARQRGRSSGEDAGI